MTAVQPPLYLGSPVSHPADSFRRLIKNLAPVAGVIGSGDLAVTANGTPNMSVNVAAGSAIIAGTEAPTTQGSYAALNDATVNLAIAAANATNPRRDLIVAKVQDADYSGAVRTWSLAVVTGTPAGSPVDPTAPANSIILARVAVAANATSITSGNITDLRPFAGVLGRTASPSTSRYSTPRKGDVNTDTDFPSGGSPLQAWNGSVWVPVDNLRMRAAASPILGVAPGNTSGQFLFQAGTSVVSVAGNVADVAFPASFPNGVLAVVVLDGDDTIPKTVSLVNGSITTSQFRIGCSTASGVIRVTWMAIGF